VRETECAHVGKYICDRVHVQESVHAGKCVQEHVGVS